MSCRHCEEKFPTQKLLKNHLTSIHGVLTVICPCCDRHEQKFKRVSDLKVHVRKFHHQEVQKLPSEFFSENNGYWCSVSPTEYARLVKPSSRDCSAAVHMRLLVLDWTKKMGSRASKSRQDFLQDWREAEAAPGFTLTPEEDDHFDYFDLEEEAKLIYINMIPGSIFADIEKGTDKFRLLVLDTIFSNTNSMRSLSRRMGELPIPSLPYGAIDLADDAREDHISYFCKFLGISRDLAGKLLSKKIILKRALVSPEKVPRQKKQRSDEATTIKKAGPLSTSVKAQVNAAHGPGDRVPATGMPRSQTVSEAPGRAPLTAAPAQKTPSVQPSGVPADPSPLTALPYPGQPTSPEASTRALSWSPVEFAVPLGSRRGTLSSSTVSTPEVSTREDTSRPVSPAQVTVPQKPSELLPPQLRAPIAKPVSSMDSSSTVRLAKARQEQLPPLPSQDYRATKLLKLGGMPHWQSARRAWDEEEEISFVEGDLTLFWPPKNWKSLTPQQKLLQWEFAAMSILKARGEDYINVHQADVLDRFNFLALPGTAPHRNPKSMPSYVIVKSRLFTYEILRAIANEELKDEKWLSMTETGAMMRDTSNDHLLRQCRLIKLRLTKD